MPLYAYKGRSARGELVTGRLDGDSAEGVASRLLGTGITPIEISHSKESSQADLGAFMRQFGMGKPRLADLVLFSRQMFTITKSGIPLLRGLRGLVTSTHHPVMRATLEDVLGSLEAGRDLADSFARHPAVFPPLFISIVRVGEATGTLEASFQRLGEYLAKDQDMQDRVKSAMRYPVIVMIAIGIAMGVLTTFVIPKFAPMFKVLGDDLPMPTRIIMGVSNFAIHYWYIVIGVGVLLVLAGRHYLATRAGRYQWHKLKLHLPAVGKLTHEAILARISRSLSISLNAGMPMIQTLTVISQAAGNDYMAEHVTQLRDLMERGEPLSRAAATIGMFPPLVLQMMAVGEETGDLPELLDEVAGFYEREVDHALKNISAAIEPILIVSVGGMVLILALGIFLPLWGMISHMGGGG